MSKCVGAHSRGCKLRISRSSVGEGWHQFFSWDTQSNGGVAGGFAVERTAASHGFAAVGVGVRVLWDGDEVDGLALDVESEAGAFVASFSR